MFRSSLFVTPDEGARVPKLPTGFSALDALLEGGLPRGQLLEISGAGKSTLAFSACLGLIEQDKAVAWIDPFTGFWPLAALEEGVPLEKFVVIRVKEGMSTLRAAHLLLGCHGAVAALVVELPSGFVPAETNLIKLQRLAEKSGTALVFLTDRPRNAASLGAAVALRLCVQRKIRGRESVLQVEVARHKGGPSRQNLEEPLRGPDRLRVRSSL